MRVSRVSLLCGFTAAHDGTVFTQCSESLGVQPEVKSADAESGLAG